MRLLVILVLACPAWAAFPAVASWDYAVGAGSCIDVGLTLSSASANDFIGTRSATTTPDNTAGRIDPDSGSSSTNKRVHICWNAASTANYLFIAEDQNDNGEVDAGEYFVCSTTETLITITGDGGNVECVNGDPPTWNPGALSIVDPVAPTAPGDLTPPAATTTYTPSTCAELNADWDTMLGTSTTTALFRSGLFAEQRCLRNGSTSNWYVHSSNVTNLRLELDIDPAFLARHAWTPFYKPKTLYLVPDPTDLAWAFNQASGGFVLDGDINFWKGANIGFAYPTPEESVQHELTVTALDTGTSTYPMTVSATVAPSIARQFWNVDLRDASGDPIGLQGRHNLRQGASSSLYEWTTLRPDNLSGTFDSGALWTAPNYLLRDCTGQTCDIHDADGLVTNAHLGPDYMTASVTGGTITLDAANPRMNSGGGGLVDNVFMTNRTVRVADSTDCDGRYNIDARGGTDNVELTIDASCTADASITVYADYEYVVRATDGTHHGCYLGLVDANTVTLEGCDLAGKTPDVLAGQFGPRPFALVRALNNTGTTWVWEPGPVTCEWPWQTFFCIAARNLDGARFTGIWGGRAGESTGVWIPHDLLGVTAGKMGNCCRDNAANEFGQSKHMFDIGASSKIELRNSALVNWFGIGFGVTDSSTVTDVLQRANTFWLDDSQLAQSAKSIYHSQLQELKSIQRLDAEGNYMRGAFPDVTGNCGNYHLILSEGSPYNFGSDVNLRYHYVERGGCLAMFAVFNRNSPNRTIYSLPRVRVQHNIFYGDFYEQPVWSDIGIVNPTGGVLFPKMSMPSLRLDRNTNHVMWAQHASTLFVQNGGWIQHASLSDNLLHVGDDFSFSQNGQPPCTGSESTFTDCYFSEATITGNQLIGTLANMQVTPGSRNLDQTGFTAASCETRWTGIGSSNPCLAGTNASDRIATAFDGSGWTPATAGKGADPELVWKAIGILPSGITIAKPGATVQLTAANAPAGELACLIGAGASSDYGAALMGATTPQVFTATCDGDSACQLNLTGLSSATYVGYCSHEVGGKPYFLAQFAF